MKAFLLAAGEGTRLRPLTFHTPKCLVPVNGTPILGIWLKQLEKVGVTDVLINTHHLKDKVESFLLGFETSLRINTVFEPELLGSAGTLKKNCDFVDGDDAFYIIYADNLTNASVANLWAYHQENSGYVTLGLFRTPNPCQCGIISLDKRGKVIKFIEKPDEPFSDLANAGIMVASQEIFDYIPSKEKADIGYDVLPQLIEYMYGKLLEGEFIDIGTPERYRQAQILWKNLNGA